ncbi:MAG TPA: carboxylating nicotinate-nucleotide diphosphorylase [Vicinamibacterales bacterium]|nr:carboxylating nicotinate-nucleotide diphosphorylase [Vicinamibacterales bacterium]
MLREAEYLPIVRRALHEDIGAGDVTTTAIVPTHVRGAGSLVAKSPLVLAGLPIALAAFRQLDAGVEFIGAASDGAQFGPGDVIGRIRGRARALLTGERVALNFLQRLSGIATLTRRFVDAAAGRIVLLDTRKTTPTLRALEKYAVRVGGGRNHRFGLCDAFLIKDNHIRVAGGIAEAVVRARASRPDLSIEVEAQSLSQVDEALSAGADVILVDNMPLEDIRAAVARCRGRAKVEISGGVTLDRIDEIAATGADFVSVGALTHSAPAADMSFEIELES